MLLLNELHAIQPILQNAKVIAIVGLSPKGDRPSNSVARYLMKAGYSIIPVNPGHDSLLGLQCYPDLLAIPVKVDIVDIFRRSELVPPIVQQAVTIGCAAIWMQQGIVHHTSAEFAKKNGIDVIMDRCIKIDHANLITEN